MKRVFFTCTTTSTSFVSVIMRNFWENFWKPEILYEILTVFAGELMSIWEHHRQAFIFETWRESLGLQNGARDFWIFVSFYSYGSKHFMLAKLSVFFFFFGNKAVKNGKETEFQKFPRTFLETRYWWAIVPSLGAFQLSVLEINSGEGTKKIVWETATFLYNFV